MSGESVRALLSGVRYEVLPAKATEDKVLAHVPRDIAVTVTASPVKGLGAHARPRHPARGARLSSRPARARTAGAGTCT
ncbi:hypothetical protein GCM10010377_47540 [Streptomyces viridiviolaceus]|nr:hypothetical protein GCM10010377_47540 [Streptomyces viridiviolaceus]